MTPLTDSAKCAQKFREIWDMSIFRSKECTYIIYLDDKMQKVFHRQLCKCVSDETLFDLKEAILYALTLQVDYIAIAHNHPSGKINPSEADILKIQSLIPTFKALNIVLVDHLILTANDHYSFRDNGLLEGSRYVKTIQNVAITLLGSALVLFHSVDCCVDLFAA